MWIFHTTEFIRKIDGIACIDRLHRKKPQLRIRFMITFHLCITAGGDHIFYESWPTEISITKKTIQKRY